MDNKLTTESILSIGEQFRQARESLNLTIEQVAKQINLRPMILEYIENDQLVHKNIPPAFMKGYIRNYAKFLKLPEQLWAVEEIHFGEKISNDLNRNTRSKKVDKSHARWIGIISFIILFVVLGMTGFWWWENYQQSNLERDNLVQNYVVEEQKKLVEQPALETSSPVSENLLNQNQLESPVVVSNEPSIVTQQAVDNPNTAQAILAQHQEKNLNNQNDLSNSSQNSTALTVEKGDLRIEIIQATSWITVKDAKRKNLAQKEYNQGEVLTFDGQGPYSLTIGAPANVKITYKGEDYPLTIDGRVARIKLQ